jgi:endonuclease/exonuclease/phosphatase family metal-dependent hydrolase
VLHSRRTGLALASLIALAACATAVNYPAEGPRFSGVAPMAAPQTTLRIVTFNTHFARKVEEQIELFRSDPELSQADVVVLQEMDDANVARIAEALGLNYVYYPATLHPKSKANFGNAILARWPIEDDRKILLPHIAGTTKEQREAVVGTLRIGRQAIRVYAVHFGTLFEIGFGGQEEQARAVVADADTSSIPVIIAGDLNSPRTGQVFEQGGFAWPTKSLGRTYAYFDFDHIFLRGPGLEWSSAGIVRDTLGTSDHRPVWAKVTVVPEATADLGAAVDSSRGLP